MLIKDLIKIGTLAGIEIGRCGNIINDRDRKKSALMDKYVRCTRCNKTTNVEKMIKDWNISTIRVLSTTHYIGEYGMIYNEGSRYMKDKYIYNVLRTMYNEYKFNNWWKDDHDNYYYVPGGYEVVEDCLIKMKNGQYFDTDSWYYFSMEESFQLTKWLKGGYRYYSSQVFLVDYYGGCEE